jgi:ubiquinone/menaquinone biosynthesis C-methylase UbiE
MSDERNALTANGAAERTVTVAEAERFYDRVGEGLDRFARFEERAKIDLAEHGRFDGAKSVFEFGCGTGALAERLLDRRLSSEARYLGIDVSATMVEATRKRLARFGGRVEVRKTDGVMRLDVGDASFDRFVSTYVMDLLSREDATAIVGEARRVLAADGLLCLASLTRGETRLSRVVSGLWSRIQRLAPARVGGCRPIRVVSLLPSDRWHIEYRRVLTMFGVPAEVVVARRLA